MYQVVHRHFSEVYGRFLSSTRHGCAVQNRGRKLLLRWTSAGLLTSTFGPIPSNVGAVKRKITIGALIDPGSPRSLRFQALENSARRRSRSTEKFENRLLGLTNYLA